MKLSLRIALALACMVVGTLPVLPASADVVKENINRVGGVGGSSGGHIVFEGNRLYMGTYGTGFRIFDIADPKAPKLIGEYEPGTPRADAVPDAAIFGGRHIMILNGTNRVNVPNPIVTVNTQQTEFFDVTDPASPLLLHRFIGPADGEAHNGDIYDAKRLWLASGGSGDNGLRIYDLQPLLDNPPDPNNLSPLNDPARLWPPDSCRNDPAVLCDPTTLWQNSPFRGNLPVGATFTHTHDMTLYPNHPVVQPDGTTQNRDIILLAEGGAYASTAGNTGSVFVIDVTDPTNPVVRYRWLHQTGAGHHPIRYHHEAIFIEGKQNLMVISDEDLHNGCGTAGGLVAVQLAPDLLSGAETSEWFIPTGTPAGVCSAHVFSTEGNLLFMGAYNAGTQVIDYSDPAKPKRVGYYIGDSSSAWGAYYNPADGYIYQGDMSRGLDVLQFLGPIPGIDSGGTTRKCPGRSASPQPQIVGTGGSDVLRGTGASEILCGRGKKDVIRGGGGRDIIIAGGGNDRASGGGGNDRIIGGGGNDRLSGGPGRDKCAGGKGTDRGRCEKGKL
ncbi:MAG: hypothetical protein ACRDH9_11775 [Actinomycetota bacterium]